MLTILLLLLRHYCATAAIIAIISDAIDTLLFAAADAAPAPVAACCCYGMLKALTARQRYFATPALRHDAAATRHGMLLYADVFAAADSADDTHASYVRYSVYLLPLMSACVAMPPAMALQRTMP